MARRHRLALADALMAGVVAPSLPRDWRMALRENAAVPEVDAGKVTKVLTSGEFPQLAAAFRKGRVPAMPDRFKLGLEAFLNSAG